ncbi:MAG: hypothetical protein RIC14_02920 [Filomicrobium sp.]
MMSLLHDLIAVILWPFKLIYWTAILLVRLVFLLIKGTFNLIVGVGLPALRFLSFVFLLVATIALVADATPAVDGFGPFQPTLLVEHLRGLAPKSVEAARIGVSNATSPLVWDFGIALLIGLPTFVFFGVLGLLAAFAGRRREKLNIFTN